MIYLLLFLEFFKVGLFTIGGGLAALPFLYELAGKYDWFTTSDITNMIAISESTPGPIAVNMATYAGYHTAGVLGGILATLGNIMPAIIIVLIVAQYLERFKGSRQVQAGFYGVRPAVAALITFALISVVRVSLFTTTQVAPAPSDSLATAIYQIQPDPIAFVLFVVFLILILAFNKHPILYIAGGAVAGIFLAPYAL